MDRAKAVELALLLAIACIGVGMLVGALWLIIAAVVVATVMAIIAMVMR